MSKVARVNDSTSGICPPADDDPITGTCGSGSSNVTVNGRAAHRKGDSGECNCPLDAKFKTSSGSNSVTVNGKPLSRVGDSTTCLKCEVRNPIDSGSPNVTCG